MLSAPPVASACFARFGAVWPRRRAIGARAMAAAVAAPAASVSQVIDDINSKYEKVGTQDARRAPPIHLSWCAVRDAVRCRCTRHTRTTSGPRRWLCRCTAALSSHPAQEGEARVRRLQKALGGSERSGAVVLLRAWRTQQAAAWLHQASKHACYLPTCLELGLEPLSSLCLTCCAGGSSR